MPARVLVVEPNAGRRRALQRALSHIADVAVCGDFVTARQHVRQATPDLLITNLRLETYNGLHLVAHAGPPTRSIVYMDPPDAGLLRVAQAAGAFVEAPQRLVAAAVCTSAPDCLRRIGVPSTCPTADTDSLAAAARRIELPHRLCTSRRARLSRGAPNQQATVSRVKRVLLPNVSSRKYFVPDKTLKTGRFRRNSAVRGLHM